MAVMEASPTSNQNLMRNLLSDDPMSAPFGNLCAPTSAATGLREEREHADSATAFGLLHPGKHVNSPFAGRLASAAATFIPPELARDFDSTYGTTMAIERDLWQVQIGRVSAGSRLDPTTNENSADPQFVDF
jgi:hypothetical protein